MLNIIYYISVLLVVIGGLNWLSVGMKGESGNFVASVVDTLFKDNKVALKYVLILVGVAAVVVAIGNMKMYNQYGLTHPFEVTSDEIPSEMMKRRR